MEKMDYESFKEELLERLKKLYDGSADVDIIRMEKNNGAHYDGIRVQYPGSSICPVIAAEPFYEAYTDGDADMADCIWTAFMEVETNRSSEGMQQFSGRMLDWEAVKEDIYPILLSTEANRKCLESLVSVPFLDLSIAYIIRKDVDGRHSSIKITKEMLKKYGASGAELHEQAMGNLRRDGCRFLDAGEVLAGGPGWEERCGREEPEKEMHILTNHINVYGAAGILDREAVREFAAGRDFFILPSSVHEMFFVPVLHTEDQKWYDTLVKGINRIEVSREDRLADHSYFYDAGKDEIRICV